MANISDKDRPWVSNYPPLHDWLIHKHNARCMWQEYDSRSHSRSVECWSIGEAQAILIIYPHGRGWDIFTPCLDTRVEDTLADAEKRLGLT